MANTIQLRRSATASAVPTTTQLALGELAINTYDGRLYLKKNVSGTETIVEVGSSSSGDVVAAVDLVSNFSSGDEGGQIRLSKSVTNTVLTTGVTIDVYQNKLRIFETGGTTRGVYIDLSTATAGVGTNLLTSNKRVVSITDATSISINSGTTDIAYQVNTQAAGTLTINAPSGSPVDGQQLMIKIKSTFVQTFAWNAAFKGSTDLSLPTATSGSSLTDYIGFIYDASSTKWHSIAKNFGF